MNDPKGWGEKNGQIIRLLTNAKQYGPIALKHSVKHLRISKNVFQNTIGELPSRDLKRVMTQNTDWWQQLINAGKVGSQRLARKVNHPWEHAKKAWINYSSEACDREQNADVYPLTPHLPQMKPAGASENYRQAARPIMELRSLHHRKQ